MRRKKGDNSTEDFNKFRSRHHEPGDGRNCRSGVDGAEAGDGYIENAPNDADMRRVPVNPHLKEGQMQHIKTGAIYDEYGKKIHGGGCAGTIILMISTAAAISYFAYQF